LTDGRIRKIEKSARGSMSKGFNCTHCVRMARCIEKRKSNACSIEPRASRIIEVRGQWNFIKKFLCVKYYPSQAVIPILP